MAELSAQKRGKELLERYQEEKHSARKSTSQFGSPIAGSVFEDGRFDAIANGSLLGMCYSESKKKERNSTPKVDRSPIEMQRYEDDDDLGAESPLEMVRFALLQLSALEDSNGGGSASAPAGSLSNITSLLQGVEEYLEKSNSRLLLLNSTTTPRKAGKVNTKLGFSAERPRRSGSEFNPEDDILNQSTYTPIKADQSSFAGYRTQRSVFMENQLDLNESEMEYYENIVNDLAEKLERMQEEKEDLQSISNSLGERLQRLSQQKEEALQSAKDFEERRLAMEARVQELETSLAAKIQDLDKEAARSAELESSLSILRAKIKDDDKKLLLTSEENASLSAQVSKLTEEVQHISSLQKDEAQLAKRQLSATEKAAETLQATVTSLTKSRQEMADRLAELEQNTGDVTQVRLQLTDAHQSETHLRAELNTLRMQHDELLEQHEKALQLEREKHRQVLQEANRAYQQLQERLHSAESAAANTSKTSAAFSSPSKRQQNRGEEQEGDDEVIAELREKVQDLEAELEDSQREVDSLSEMVEDLRMKISSGEDAAATTAGNTSDVQAADSSELDVSVIRIATSPSGKHVQRITTTANNLASHSQAQNVYMENQLDLNESELQYYEEVVNELGNQLDTVRAQVDSVTAERDELLDAREALQETIDELQAALNTQDNEDDATQRRLQDLEHLMEARDREIGRLTERAEEAESRAWDLEHLAESRDMEIRRLTERTEEAESRAEASLLHSSTVKTTPQSAARTALSTEKEHLTNEFLGISSSAEDSDVEGEEEQVSELFPSDQSHRRGRDPSASFDSFHSTAEHVYHRNDSQELRRIIQQREDQIKAQIAQLQSQQDTLQEHKDALEVLRSQKASLKKALSEATVRVEALQAQEVEHLNRKHDLEERLQDSEGFSEGMQRQYAELESKYEEANFKVSDLLQLTTQYRLQLEDLQQQPQSSQESGNKPLLTAAATPSPPSTISRGPGESGGSRSERHEHNSLQQRLRMAEAQVDELSLAVRSAERAHEDTQLELDKIQVRFQAKLRLAEEQNQDIMDLRLEIDKLLEENDRIKLHEMQTETTCRLKEIDNQGEIELLQQRVCDLEEENRQLIESLRARQLELQNEIDSNKSLREIMQKFGEKDSSTETLLLEMRTERDSARKQLTEASEKLQSQARSMTEYQEQCSVLQLQLQHRDAEALSMSKRLELLQGEAQGETRSLYLRVEDLSTQNETVEDALREQKQKTGTVERELKARSAELESSRRSLRNLVDVVRSHYSKVLNAQDALAQTVHTRLTQVDGRVEDAAYNVQHTLERVASVMNDTEGDRRLVEKALKDTQALLQNALDQHDRDAAEKEEAWAKCDAAHQHIEELQTLLDDVNAQLSERIHQGQDHDAAAQIVEEEVHNIKQRLSEAELQAEQMSSESARAFAKSARTIAYLEGESTRLKTLLDHLRVVNAKLNGDLKAAHLESMRCKSLEHRAKLTEQDQAALQKRITALESTVQQKEQELLDGLERAREHEEERLERFENDYNTINAQFRALQDKNAVLLSEHAALKETLEQTTADHTAEVNSIQLKLQNLQKNTNIQQKHVEEVEYELRTVRTALQEQEHLYVQANTKISLLTEEVRVSKDTHASAVRELTNEVRDRTEVNRTKEQQLAQLKAQVGRLESEFVQRDEEIAGKLLRRVAADDENRQLRAQLDTQSSDLTLMRGRIEDLQIQVTSLTQSSEALQEQDANSRAELQLTVIKLQETNDTVRKLSEELENLESEYSQSQESLTARQVELSAAEEKLQAIETEFFTIQANEQALAGHNETLTEQNAYLRKQVDELVPKLSAASRESVSLRSQLNEQTDLVMELRRETEDNETRMLRVKDSFTAVEIAEADIVAEMREISELLASKVGVERSAMGRNEDSSATTGKSQQEHFHIGMDLFASPPLAVMRSPVNLYSSIEGTDLTADMSATQSDVLSGIKYTISSLKGRANNLLVAYLKTFEALEKTSREKDDLRKDFERAKEKIQLGNYDREVLAGKLSATENEQEELRRRVEMLTEHNTAWLSGSTAHSQRISALLRDMDSGLLESLAKANDAVAGVIPISTDALPNLRISEAIVQFDEARGQSSFNQIVPTDGAEIPQVNHQNSSAVLTVSVNEVTRATDYLLGVIRNLVKECKHRADVVHKTENATELKETAWERERSSLFEQQAELETSMTTLQKQHAQVVGDLEAHKLQLERTNHRVQDLLDHNTTLEGELSDVLGQRSELKQELSRYEATCLDLRGKLRTTQQEVDKRTDDLHVVNEQFAEMQQRITEGELTQERTSTLLGRTRAEKDALDNVRRSLESELERSRAEVISLRECTKVIDQEHRSSFEVEKMLAALTTTMDQIVATSSNSTGLRTSQLLNSSAEQQNMTGLLAAGATGTANSSFVSMDSHQQQQKVGALTVISDSDAPLASRVDTAVKRLSSLRHWSREEARAKRILESNLESASADATAAQQSAEEAQKQVKQLLHTATQREKELKERTAEVLERDLEVRRLQDELDRLRNDGTSISGRLETEKKLGLTLTEQLAAREQECARLTGELESRTLNVTKLQEELQSAHEQLAAALAETERRAEQLRVAKSNSDRIMTTMEQIERGAASDKIERESAERRCAEAEEQLASMSRLRSRAAELEQKLVTTKEESKAAHRAKVAAEEHSHSLQQHLDIAQKKVSSLEHRIETIKLEKNTFVDEVAETRRKIALAKQYADQERAQRMRSDAAMVLLKRSGEETRVDRVEYATLAEEADSLQSRAEEEKRSLRQQINQLKHANEERENMHLTELHDRKKLESDIKQLKTALAKRDAELASSSNYSAQLRTEGRHARQLVMNAVKHIREILTAVKMDAQSAGVELLSPETTRSSRSGRHASETPQSMHAQHGKDPVEVSYDEALGLGLGEALGISDLTRSLESLREAMSYISAAPVNRQSLQARLTKLEAEHSALQKELQSSETKRTELVSRYKEEIQTMHLHITELRRTDSKNPHLTHQIAELESTVKAEKERREKVLAENSVLRSRLEQASREAPHTHRSSESAVLQTELDSMRAEFEQYRAENAELVQELSAVNHHRTVLRDTIEQLDREVREKVDMLTDLQATAGAYPAHGVGVDSSFAALAQGELDDGLHRQVLRYKARAAAVDDLASIYRTSVLALYSDGASYSAAQFGGVPSDAAAKTQGVQLIGVGWIEREMTAVKHSYEDEVRILDSEVAELRAKLRQSNSYIQELRRRFEESMRSIYRSGRGATGTAGSKSDGAQPFEQFQQEMETLHTEVNALQHDLANERAQGRGRHTHLVETLTAALQARDAALGALKRLEEFCSQRGVDIDGLAIYESLKADMANLNSATQAYDQRYSASQGQHQQVVDTLMRGLVEADHELAESERRQRARQRAAVAGAGLASSGTSSLAQSRSNSRGSARQTYTSYNQQQQVYTSSAQLSASASSAVHGHARHQSPSASASADMRVHSSSAPSTPATATRQTAPNSGLATRGGQEKSSAYTEQMHEQRLTRDFLTRTSPTRTSPSATPQQATAAVSTRAAQENNASHLLSTTAVSHTHTYTRSHRDSSSTSFQLPVTNHTGAPSGTGSLRVSRAPTPGSASSAARSTLGSSRRVPNAPTASTRPSGTDAAR